MTHVIDDVFLVTFPYFFKYNILLFEKNQFFDKLTRL